MMKYHKAVKVVLYLASYKILMMDLHLDRQCYKTSLMKILNMWGIHQPGMNPYQMGVQGMTDIMRVF